jgi:hypothetical protein
MNVYQKVGLLSTVRKQISFTPRDGVGLDDSVIHKLQ